MVCLDRKLFVAAGRHPAVAWSPIRTLTFLCMRGSRKIYSPKCTASPHKRLLWCEPQRRTLCSLWTEFRSRNNVLLLSEATMHFISSCKRKHSFVMKKWTFTQFKQLQFEVCYQLVTCYQVNIKKVQFLRWNFYFWTRDNFLNPRHFTRERDNWKKNKTALKPWGCLASFRVRIISKAMLF